MTATKIPATNQTPRVTLISSLDMLTTRSDFPNQAKSFSVIPSPFVQLAFASSGPVGIRTRNVVTPFGVSLRTACGALWISETFDVVSLGLKL